MMGRPVRLQRLQAARANDQGDEILYIGGNVSFEGTFTRTARMKMRLAER